MAKLDIYKPGWIEVVFTGRNQAYGAYELRKNNSKSTSRAMLIGGTMFILCISSSTIYKAISGFVPNLRDRFAQTEIKLSAPPPIDKKIVPPPVEAPKPKVAEIRFPPPVVVPADEVKDQEPPTISDLRLADISSRTIEGDPNADIKIEVAEPVKVAIKIVEDEVFDKETVQILPQFPGGNAAWNTFMQGYNFPAMARENNISGTIYVNFVVEKDGSLTDITVLHEGLGFGTAEEAIRLLKTSPKWKAGIQNGLPVRVSYTQPIKLAIQ
jgi:protein TonB